ncbi:Squalene epoxidase [Tulasnella sp. 403]|nr:Squalene epoxidase [Tulasnella sp. 403]
MSGDTFNPGSRYPSSNHFDVIIVGAGIAGPALTYALSTIPKSPQDALRIALMDRSFVEPNRIVGELMQPGGMQALRELGMEDCVEGIDAIREYGYAVLYQGSTVHIPYPNNEEGRSFHHGRFVMKLREKARTGKGVEMIEATVSDLIESPEDGKVVGVRATRKAEDPSSAKLEEFYADIVFAADGWSSKFRSKILGAALREPKLKSHFVGFVLEDVTLPIPNHGTVALVPGTGPVLIYQIGARETRMLVDVQGGLPKDMAAYVQENIIPALPENMRDAILACLAKGKPKSMPNSFLPASLQGSKHHKPGAILLGDAWNMRHPLTGGGMTVALSDVVIVRRLLEPLVNDPTQSDATALQASQGPFANWDRMVPVLTDLHWQRKGLASTVNILSVALYDLFGAEDENLHVLREGCFKYFERGGACVSEPVSLLAGIAPRPLLLAYHFFAVAFYAIYILFTQPRLRKRVVLEEENDHIFADVSSEQIPQTETELVVPSYLDYPYLTFRSVAAVSAFQAASSPIRSYFALKLYTAAVVFLPLVWTEIRWW